MFGAQNLAIEGNLYDVQFVDGSCIELFSGCDEVSDFAFANKDEAKKASKALFDQVLIDDMGAPAPFDTNFLLTNGCEHNYDFDACAIVTPTLDAFDYFDPISLYRGSSSAWNTALEEHPDAFQRDWDVSVGGPENYDTRLNRITVYADWTRVSAVPVPAAI